MSLLYKIKQNLHFCYNSPNNWLTISSWAFARLGNVYCHLENCTATGHYREVTLFWLCHWLIYLSPVGSSHMIDTANKMLISTTRSCSLALCQRQLQGSTAAIQHKCCYTYPNRPSMETWQNSRIEKKYSNYRVFSGTQHAADWSKSDHFGKRLSLSMRRQEFNVLRISCGQ